MKSLKTVHQKIVAIVLASVLLSLGYSFWYQIPPTVDPQAYDKIAVNLVAGNGFREIPNKDFNFDHAMLRAGPGYEFFLAVIYKVFGHNYAAVWIIQAFLHGLTVWLIYKTARLLWSDESGVNIGLIAAAVIGFHPDLIEISAMLMTETLYLCLVALFMYGFAQLQQKISWQGAVLLGLGLGLGLLTRPPLILFVPIILVFFIVKKSWKESILFLAAIMVVLTPWTVRNYQVFNSFIPTTLIGDYNIWVGNTLVSNGGQLSSGFNPVTTQVAKHGIVSLPSAASHAFTTFIREHPGTFVKLTAIRTVRYASLIRPMGFWFYQDGLPQLVFVALSGLSISVLFVFGLSGLMLLGLRSDKNKWYWIALALSAPLPLLVPVVESRYSFQIYPFLALAGAWFFTELKQHTEMAKMSLCISAFILLGFTLIDLGFFWETAVEHLKRFI